MLKIRLKGETIPSASDPLSCDEHKWNLQGKPQYDADAALFTFVSDIFERLPVDKLDNVAASQSLIDNLQEHAHKHHTHS